MAVAGVIAIAHLPAEGANLTWDTVKGDGTTITSGSGNWNLTSLNYVWNNAGSNQLWSQSGVGTATNTSIFGGLEGNHTITIEEQIYTQAINVVSSGYTFTASAPQQVMLTNNGTGVLSIAADKNLTVGNNAILYFSNSTVTSQRILFGAGSTLNIAAGGTVSKISSSNDGLGKGTLAMTGNGTLNISGTYSYVGPTNSGGHVLALFAGDAITVNVNPGGLISSNSNLLGIVLCESNNTAILNVSGSITTSGTTTYGGINMIGSGDSGTATINLNATGSISTNAIRPVYNGSVQQGTSTFNFDGGVLKPIANHTAFMTGLSAVNIKSGGANIDTNGYNITVGNALLNGGGNGGLTKNGAGTLTLTGTDHTFTGPTLVNSGKLITANALQNKTALNINNGSSVEVSAGGTSSKVTVISQLNLSGSGAHLELHDNDLVWDYGSNPSTYLNTLNLIKSGLAILGGNATDGIKSAEVDQQTIPGTILALVDDGDPLIAGAITEISGFTIPSPASSVLLKFTWFGDSNLDGIVDGSDYALIDTGFTAGGVFTGWVFGDYDYNGVIDGSDYALIDTGFLSQTSSLPEPVWTGIITIMSWLGCQRLRVVKVDKTLR